MIILMVVENLCYTAVLIAGENLLNVFGRYCNRRICRLVRERREFFQRQWTIAQGLTLTTIIRCPHGTEVVYGDSAIVIRSARPSESLALQNGCDVSNGATQEQRRIPAIMTNANETAKDSQAACSSRVQVQTSQRAGSSNTQRRSINVLPPLRTRSIHGRVGHAVTPQPAREVSAPCNGCLPLQNMDVDEESFGHADVNECSYGTLAKRKSDTTKVTPKKRKLSLGEATTPHNTSSRSSASTPSLCSSGNALRKEKPRIRSGVAQRLLEEPLPACCRRSQQMKKDTTRN